MKKIILKPGETWFKLGDFHKANYVRLHKRKLLSPSPVLGHCSGHLGLGSRSLLLDTTDTSESSFFILFFFFHIKIKLKQKISQTTEAKRLYCTHCH